MKEPRCEYYKDSKGEWRGRIKAKNSKIIADLSKGYKNRSGIRKAFFRLLTLAETYWENFLKPQEVQK